MTVALVIIALAALGYTAHAATHGDWMPALFAACLFGVYACAFAGEWCLRRRADR